MVKLVIYSESQRCAERNPNNNSVRTTQVYVKNVNADFDKAMGIFY